jgi:A/G-specific adenine glycosylase
MAWTDGLARWYATQGRHELPWRHTRDPWAVLVSEIMLQQTQVARVLPYWSRFIERWPTPAACAAAPLKEVLREWHGLGYPRRALALHDSAGVVAVNGWPRSEAALRRLPGVGAYTARALLTLALEEPSAPPLDVNIARVVARAARGVEPAEASPRSLEAPIDAARPRSLDRRHYTFALFDVGALHCRPRPRCEGCPLRRRCASRTRLRQAAPSPARRPVVPYASSMRRLRGILLAAALAAGGELSAAAAAAAARTAAPDLELARRPDAIEAALSSLRADRLI